MRRLLVLIAAVVALAAAADAVDKPAKAKKPMKLFRLESGRYSIVMAYNDLRGRIVLIKTTVTITDKGKTVELLAKGEKVPEIAHRKGNTITIYSSKKTQRLMVCRITSHNELSGRLLGPAGVNDRLYVNFKMVRLK